MEGTDEMNLTCITEENKAHIDSLSYEELLRHYRFAETGDPWFQKEIGAYWLKRMQELRSQPNGDAIHIAASKSIGW